MTHPLSTVEVEVAASDWEIAVPRDYVLPQRVLDFKVTYPELLEELDLNRYAFREIRQAITDYANMHYGEDCDLLDSIILGNWKKSYNSDRGVLISFKVDGEHTEREISEMLRHLHDALSDMDYEQQIIAMCLEFPCIVYCKPD